MIIPNIWENKKCSKPPTRLRMFQTTNQQEFLIALWLATYASQGVKVQEIAAALFLAMEIQRQCWESKKLGASHDNVLPAPNFPFPSWIMAQWQWHLMLILHILAIHRWRPVLYISSPSFGRLKSPHVLVQNGSKQTQFCWNMYQQRKLNNSVEICIKPHMVLGHANLHKFRPHGFSADSFVHGSVQKRLSPCLTSSPFRDWH